ncbi:hypothetical protein BC938DRAFT_471009, partial [Jimgerdemannia flammicorona]
MPPPLIPTSIQRHQKHNQPFAADSRNFYVRVILLALFGTLVFFQLLSSSTETPTFLSEPLQHAEAPQQQQQLPPPQQVSDLPPEIFIANTTVITPSTATRIPNIVHFVHGLKDPDPQLDLIHYLAIKSAHDVLNPTKIYFHYHYLPHGEWFDRARLFLTLRHVELPTKIYNNSVDGYAHRADIVRLDALLEFGGIYMDMDLLSLKPFAPLLDAHFVMGEEGQGGWSGLCNAVILARPNAPFLQRWRATYKTFDQRNWNHHSVVLPGILAKYFPDEVCVLGYKAFFWPLWDKKGLRTMYLEKSYGFEENYGIHLWESAARVNLMKGITVDVVRTVDNSLYCEIRRFLREKGEGTERDEGCVILERTQRPDRLVGHWPLLPPGPDTPITDPLRLSDISGNHLSGLVRQGTFADPVTATAPTLHLNGRDSYIFLPLPTKLNLTDLTVSFWLQVPAHYTKEGAVALMLHTDHIKVNLETHLDQSLSFAIRTLLYGVNTSPDDDDAFSSGRLDVPAGPHPVNDGSVHHYALAISHRRSRLTLYVDGSVALSSVAWRPPNPEAVVRGVWIGSPEPEDRNYQDPWDEQRCLEGTVRDVRVWEREMGVDEVRGVVEEGWDEGVREEEEEEE